MDVQLDRPPGGSDAPVPPAAVIMALAPELSRAVGVGAVSGSLVKAALACFPQATYVR